MEEAGADAIELNIYSISTEPSVGAAEVEKGYVDFVRQIKRTTRIPVAVKLSPFFSAPANIALRLDDAGADGLVLFNRFYQPDFDVGSLEVVPRLTLSHPDELLLRLHWTAILSDHVEADLAVTGGVHSAVDVVKAIMAGASVTMVASVLLQKGIHHACSILSDLRRWLEEHEYDSVRQMCGSMSRRSVPDPSALDRKSTRLNSSHGYISYAVFCLKKKNILPYLFTSWICKLLILIFILPINLITSCSVTMMLFLHLELIPLMTLTTFLELTSPLIP